MSTPFSKDDYRLAEDMFREVVEANVAEEEVRVEFLVTDPEYHEAKWICRRCESEWDEWGTGYVLRGEFIDDVQQDGAA